jgi:glycerol uptake facilitator-like aquaporin
LFVVGQCIGSIGGVYLGHSIKGGPLTLFSSFNAKTGIPLTLFYECVLAMAGTFVLFTVFVDYKFHLLFSVSSIGLVAGISIFYAILFGGLSLNPTRSFGLAVVSNYWDYHYLWWIGSITGCLLMNSIRSLNRHKKVV